MAFFTEVYYLITCFEKSHMTFLFVQSTVKPVLRGHPREGQKVAA